MAIVPLGCWCLLTPPGKLPGNERDQLSRMSWKIHLGWGENNYDFHGLINSLYRNAVSFFNHYFNYEIVMRFVHICGAFDVVLPINFVVLFPQMETRFKAFCNELNYIIQNQYRRRPSNLQWWQQLELIHHVNARVRVSSPSLWHPNRFIFNQLIHYGRFRWRWMNWSDLHSSTLCFLHGYFGIGQSWAKILFMKLKLFFLF